MYCLTGFMNVLAGFYGMLSGILWDSMHVLVLKQIHQRDSMGFYRILWDSIRIFQLTKFQMNPSQFDP